MADTKVDATASAAADGPHDHVHDQVKDSAAAASNASTTQEASPAAATTDPVHEAPAVSTETSNPTSVDNAVQDNKPAEADAASRTSAARPSSSIDVDKSKPEDFEGHVATTSEIPSAETLEKIKKYVVLDRHGKTHTFESLYSGPNVARRVLVIFVRHFFCGLCQMYLRTLSESITPEALLRLPVSTFIAVVGCGDPGLIDMYARDSACAFPIYTDPQRSLFNELGLIRTLDMGAKPAYQSEGMLKNSLSSLIQGLKQVPRGLGLKSGDYRQVGGEFLFEPQDIASPIHTPVEERKPFPSQAEQQQQQSDEDESGRVEEKKVTWCHRMKTTRDHAEIPELMEILGLDGEGQPIKDQKRWSKALTERKGTGLSMASQMSELSESRKES